MANLLEISNLTLDFGGIKAVDNLSIAVPANSFVGLIGPNGAGKTTLINCLSRVYNPEKGTVLLEGQNLLSMTGDQVIRLGVARTFQDLNFFSLIPDMMVIDYLRLGQFTRGKNRFFGDAVRDRASRAKEWELKKRARRILEFFREMREELEPPQVDRGYPIMYGKEGFADLIDVEHQPIDTLSFAWRRRLDLARALVSQPRLLLLDEPAQGLPPSEIENLGKVFEKIRLEFGVSALIVEHNMPMLMEISDQVVVMDAGKKIAQGSPTEIQQNPEVIHLYLGKSNEVAKEKLKIENSQNLRVGQPILSIRDLDLYYGKAQALFGVSLDLYPHQITTVLGTNGSGKSTLLKAVSGVEKPTYGEILVNGEFLPLGWPELAAERDVQYVPQGHVIFPEMTVFDNLRIGGYLPSVKRGYKIKSEIERILHFFPRLKDLLQVQATKLSGGQQQMLSIAQALMAKPKILLLDEPSLGLAPLFVDAIFSIIKNICVQEGCSILLVEQNVAKALEISDYVYMLNSGTMAGEGTSEQFRSDTTLISKKLGFF